MHSSLIPVWALIIAMTMPAVHEKVHEYAPEQQQVRQRAEYMCPVLRPEEEGGDAEKHEQDHIRRR
jgi:hypothetical protein